MKNKLIKEKKTWIEEVERLLKLDPRSNVLTIEYLVDEYNESVNISFENGGNRTINITGNSLAAILSTITNAVYF